MIPVLYDASEMAFTSMGIGTLADAQKVTIKRVLNGVDELEMVYPVGGTLFTDLAATKQILAMPEYKKEPQAYRIYQVTKPMNGSVTVLARHISERRNYLIVEPFEATDLAHTLTVLPTKITEQHPFTFYTDKSVSTPYKRDVPSSLGSVLGGSAGSLLDLYGGEYEFDMYQVRLLSRRGMDRGVTVAYGKNLTKLEVTNAVDESVITSVCPVWIGEEEQVFLPEYIVDSQYVSAYPYRRAAVVDFSGDFEEAPTVAELRAKANAYIRRNAIGVPITSIKISFEHLAQYEEYKGMAILETLNLGDTVTIRHNDLGVDISARIVETRFDTLHEKYNSVTVGRVQSNMSSTLKTIETTVDKKIKENKNYTVEAVANATDLIAGAKGGNVVMNKDADGKPYEILIMDTADKMTATNVIRINQNGIGFSRTGYNGPFLTAWTIDGNFVADFITAGTLSGDRVRTGLISDVSGRNYWNLNTGEWVNKSLNDRLDNMQDQIDDNIQTWSGADVPTLNNYPASSWTTAAIKDTHVGDLYIISSGAQEGTYYRFLKTGNVYEWKVLTDTEVQQALAEAEEALRRVSEAETAIEQNSQAIALRATKTEAQGYATTAAGAAQTAAENTARNYTDGQLGNYSTTTQMNAAIEAKADEIELSVSQTYTTKADFENLAIGGRNLIINTAVPDVSSADKYPKIFKQLSNTAVTAGTKSTTEHGIKTTNTGAVRTYIAFGYTTVAAQKSLCGLIPGETYTLSADVEWKLLSGTQNNTTYYMQACLYDDKATQGTFAREQYIDLAPIPPDKKGTEMSARCEFTFTVPDNATIAYVSFQCNQSTASHYAAGDYIALANIKLEKGNRATDWTPAPEDTEEQIARLDASIQVLPGEIASKVSLEDYTGAVIASLINQSATTVLISAAHIDLNGVLTVGNFDSETQALLVKSVATKNEYAQSDSSSTAPTSGWRDTIPAYNARRKYVWVRVATTRTFVDNTTNIVRSDAVVDINLTKAIEDAATAQSTATGAVSIADDAVGIANQNVRATVSVYYRSTTASTPSIDATTTIYTSYNVDDRWTYVLPQPSRGKTFFTCERYTYGDGSVGFSAVRQMTNLTVTSLWCSAENRTLIDGGSIYAGSITGDKIRAGTITADKIAANSIFTQKLTAMDFTITGGSIQIDTNNSTYDALTLNYIGAGGAHLMSKVQPGSVQVSSDETSVHLDADGIRFMEGGLTKGWLPAAGIKFIEFTAVIDAQTELEYNKRNIFYAMTLAMTKLENNLISRESELTPGSFILIRYTANITGITSLEESWNDEYTFLFTLGMKKGTGYGRNRTNGYGMCINDTNAYMTGGDNEFCLWTISFFGSGTSGGASCYISRNTLQQT